MNITPWGENDKVTVSAFEQQIGFALPEDYRQFLINNNGGRVNDQMFFVKGLGQAVLMHVLYGLTNTQSRGLTLGYWLAEHADDIGEKELVIGHDPGGYQLLLVIGGDDKGGYYWDHNNFFPQSADGGGNTYFVANTFAEFINSLRDYSPPGA